MNTILAAIAARFTSFAAALVPVAIEAGKNLLGKVVAEGEDAFLALVEKFGEKATQLVTDLFADDTLKGIEKANLAATQLVEHAAENGVELAAHDASTLIKSAFLAVKSELAKL